MTTNDLVCKGYFPEELPPPFNTKQLNKIIAEVLANPEKYPIEEGTGKKKKPKIFKAVPFSTPKIRAYRRTLSLPHPLHYIWLSSYLVKNWKEIEDFTKRSKVSLSPLKRAVDTQRAIAQPSFDTITTERIVRSTGFKYLLKVDIQKFYGSIYTHSIPWVLHTKKTSKANRNPDGLLGNKIDWFVRNMQDGQTIGIPIGPDSSRVVSEIIATYLDIELEKELGELNGIRVVDDYSLYFFEFSELEKARSLILKLLREIELDLNQAKEKVISLPEIIETKWYNHLRQFKFSNKRLRQPKDIIAYFDASFQYSQDFPEDAVLAYSISKICATVFQNSNWKILESLLLKSLQIEPKVLPYVVKLFISHKEKGYPLSMDVVSNTLNSFLISHLYLDNHFEVVWALWFSKLLGLRIKEDTAVELSKQNNDVIILAALDLNEAGLIPKGLDTTDWEALMTSENLYSEHWLLAYEANYKQWLECEDYIADEPFFNMLRSNKVAFYDNAENVDLSNIKVSSESVSLAKYRSGSQDEEEIMEYNEDDNEYKSRRKRGAHMPRRNYSHDDLGDSPFD